MTKRNTTAKTIFASLGIALALTGTVLVAAPTKALANDGLGNPTATTQAVHHEGDKVTIGEDWKQPVYAEWHRGDSGKWWATFYTYNYNYVYAEPAIAGCGWNFYTYDNGEFVQIYRVEESAEHGLYGKEGVSSHWSNQDGSRWY